MIEKIQQHLIAAGMSSNQAAIKEQLFKIALDRLHARDLQSVEEPCLFYVPGRIEFLGKHTDYAGGRSLVCSVDRGFCIVAVPRKDRWVRVAGETASQDINFEIHPGLTPTTGHWSNYPMTVARRMARNFSGDRVGADIAFVSDLPASSGLSSSSALIIAFFFALSAINRIKDRDEFKANIRSPTDLAGYLGTIENGQSFGSLIGDRGVGTFGGSQDHTAILLGKPQQLSQFSFCPVKFERDIPLPGDHSLVVALSGVIAEKTGAAQADYNNASLATQKILETWREATGRTDATLADAVAYDAVAVRKILQHVYSPNVPYLDRFDQFVAESTQIIPAAGDAMLAKRWDLLGPLVDQSQALASRLLKNQVPQTDFLASTARRHGAIAASAFGAGFGGSVWAMVQSDIVDSFIADWKKTYQSEYPQYSNRASFFTTTAGIAAVQVGGAYGSFSFARYPEMG